MNSLLLTSLKNCIPFSVSDEKAIENLYILTAIYNIRLHANKLKNDKLIYNL